jgi:hypothetical protein
MHFRLPEPQWEEAAADITAGTAGTAGKKNLKQENGVSTRLRDRASPQEGPSLDPCLAAQSELRSEDSAVGNPAGDVLPYSSAPGCPQQCTDGWHPLEQ